MANNQIVLADSWAGGSLSPKWGSLNSGFPQVVVGSPNVVESASAGGLRWGCVYNGTISSDQLIEVTINSATLDAGTSVGLYCRVGGSNGYYVANINMAASPAQYAISRNFGAAFLSGSMNTQLALGDILSFSVIGNCFSLYQNFKRVVYGYDTGANP